MKRIAFSSFAGLMVLTLAASAAVAGTPAETPAQELPDGQARVVIPIEGLTCGGCCARVEAAVKELDGIVATKADHQKGQATVTYVEGKVTVKKIVETINDKTSYKASIPKKADKAGS